MIILKRDDAMTNQSNSALFCPISTLEYNVFSTFKEPYLVHDTYMNRSNSASFFFLSRTVATTSGDGTAKYAGIPLPISS